MEIEGRKRVVIENVKPEIDCGLFPIKRTVGEKVVVEADIFADGHDSVSARLLYKKGNDEVWSEVPMIFIENDRWRGEFRVHEIGDYYYTVEGWVDHFKTWQKDIKKKFEAGQDIKVDVLVGIGYIEDALKRAKGDDKKRLVRIISSLKNSSPEEVPLIAFSNELVELMDKYCSVAKI